MSNSEASEGALSWAHDPEVVAIGAAPYVLAREVREAQELEPAGEVKTTLLRFCPGQPLHRRPALITASASKLVDATRSIQDLASLIRRKELNSSQFLRRVSLTSWIAVLGALALCHAESLTVNRT